MIVFAFLLTQLGSNTMGTPKKAKKSPPQSPKKGPNGRGFFPIAEEFLGRDVACGLNMYTRSIIKTMWAGHYKVVDIQRRLALASFPVSRKAIVETTRRDTLEDAPRSGRPRSSRTPSNIRVVKNVLKATEWKPCSLKQLRAKVAKKNVVLPLRTLRQLKREDLGYTGRRGKKKPERAMWTCNRNKRVVIAKERLKWSVSQTKRVIWIDQSQCSRDGTNIFQQRRGQQHVLQGVPDNKEEKVHYVIGIGNGWKSGLEALPIKRPVVRDGAGNAVAPTLLTGRRRAGQGVDNARLNKANCGEQWTFEKMKKLCDKWMPQLRRAWKVVIDNAPAHHQLKPYLLGKGVSVADQAPYSPDHNLAENAHRDIKECPRSARCENNEQLLQALHEEWKGYKPAYFADTYCPKYKARMKATIDGNGYPTKY